MTLPDPTIVDRPASAVNASTVGVAVRWAVAFVCAASAGVHAALVPEHLEHGPEVGVAFAGSAVALGVGALVVRRAGRLPRVVPALLLAVACAYLLSRTTGIPVLVPEPEPPDLLGMLTTAAEVIAAAAAYLPLDREESR